MDKRKIIQHICAFIAFASCITAVVLLLTKCRVKNGTTDIADNTDLTDTPQTNSDTTTTSTNGLSKYWNPDASLSSVRVNHEVALLANGKIMISGGRADPSTILQVCEFYSPFVGWQLGAVMIYPRFYFTLTPFAGNTKVLAAGSADPESQSTAEIYDITNDQWTSTLTNMSTGRFAHAATLLNNEQILIMGGVDILGHIISSTELFIPSSNSFVQANDLNIGRALFTSTLLNDGSTVLVAGGGDKYGRMTSTAECFVSGSWIRTKNNMIQGRAYHTAVLLQNGNVLIAGGGDGAFISFSTAEIYNPITRTFTRIAPMNYRRALFTLTLLPSGKVLATGGIDWSTYTYPAVCELYDPISQTWSPTRMLNIGRNFHRSVLLNDSVLTIGGYNMNNNQTNTCEKYTL